MPERQGKDMKLRITACRQIYSGSNRRGDSYTIFEVEAQRATDGQKINEKLRAFTALPIGEVIEVTVTPFDSEQHGRSFTIYRKEAASKRSTQDQLNELHELFQATRGMVSALAARVGELEQRVGSEASQSTEPNGRSTPRSEALDASFGGEAPW